MERSEIVWTPEGLQRLAEKISDTYKFDIHRFCVDCMPTVIDTLTDREAIVIFCKFELSETHDKIGERFNVTRERIRQIVAKAIRKLWHPRRQDYYIYKHPNEYLMLKKKLETVMSEHRELLNEYNSLLDSYVNSKEYQRGVYFNKDLNEIRIDDLELSVRAFNCLRRAGIVTLYDLALMSMDKLMRVRNLGRQTLNEIVEKAKEYGITFVSEGES